MPILPAEPDLFPDNLFDQVSPPQEDNQPEPEAEQDSSIEVGPPRWWCLHTKPRQEKATARFLRKNKLSYYLPLVVQENRTPKGRKTRSLMPLFPSYVFFWGDRRDRLSAFQGHTLVNILQVGDQRQLDYDLRQIHQMLNSGLPVVAEPEYPVGSEVRILSGPLQGITGTVIKRGNKSLFVAVVEFLGRGAEVELQSWQIEPIGQEAS